MNETLHESQWDLVQMFVSALTYSAKIWRIHPGFLEWDLPFLQSSVCPDRQFSFGCRALCGLTAQKCDFCSMTYMSGFSKSFRQSHSPKALKNEMARDQELIKR